MRKKTSDRDLFVQEASVSGTGDSPGVESGALNETDAPLAVKMRPKTLDEVIGQKHILGEGKLLRRTIQTKRWTSMVFYGPPGSGKTTLARVISRETQSRFAALNAVTSNVAEIRKVIEEAAFHLRQRGQKTILFIDEIHRFNKAQQDVLMPDVEAGNVILIGATTHNPSFSINGPLLSRSIIFELRPLEEEDLILAVQRALRDPENGFGTLKVEISAEALRHLAKSAVGDARRVLNALEVGVLTTSPNAEGLIIFDKKVAEESCQRKIVYYDGDEDYHYDTASAFIKSMRGSDPDAAIYWLAKMIYAGEDLRFIMRRILILASEDIGNADPQALILASAGLQAVEFVGLPEAQIILAQLVTYMAMAPKSNASYRAISSAMQDVKEGKIDEVPTHLRDKSYSGSKRMGHGEGYIYPHSAIQSGDPFKIEALDGQKYFNLKNRYYHPTASGFEKQFLDKLKALKQVTPP
jgi:putative ATPase